MAQPLTANAADGWTFVKEVNATVQSDYSNGYPACASVNGWGCAWGMDLSGDAFAKTARGCRL